MKYFFTMLAAVAALFFVACSGGSATPGDAVVKVYDQLAKGNYEAVADAFYFGNENPEQEAQARAMLVSMFNEKGAKQMESKGGIKSYEVINETIAEDGKTAKVEVKIIYGNGTEDTNKVDMVLDEKGNWRPSMKK